jgi:hypothetical protein
MIVKRALEEPIRQIVENAGLEGSVIAEKVKSETAPNRGYDADSIEYVDMVQAGIIDPTKVERVALQNAASIASLLLTTEVLITDVPEEKSAAAPAMPHGATCISSASSVGAMHQTERRASVSYPDRGLSPAGRRVWQGVTAHRNPSLRTRPGLRHNTLSTSPQLSTGA